MDSPSLLDPGILRTTLLPNLIFHTSLAVPTYLVARSTNLVEAKDVLWSASQVANAWYTSVGRYVLHGVPLASALKSIDKPGWLVLSGITLWGSRLCYRVISRAVRRQGDDARYVEAKKDAGFWNKSILTSFVPEILTQALIALPIIAPFRHVGPVMVCPREARMWVEAAAIGLFGVGFAMEALADWQLDEHKVKGDKGMLKSGVWSIVRHPNYLGDTLTHLSFPLLLYSQNLFSPYTLLGPLANWFFLRFISGDHEAEASQEERYGRTDPEKKVDLDVYRMEKNAFWPGLTELANPWTWGVVAMGAAVVGVERAVEVLVSRA